LARIEITKDPAVDRLRQQGQNEKSKRIAKATARHAVTRKRIIFCGLVL